MERRARLDIDEVNTNRFTDRWKRNLRTRPSSHHSLRNLTQLNGHLWIRLQELGLARRCMHVRQGIDQFRLCPCQFRLPLEHLPIYNASASTIHT